MVDIDFLEKRNAENLQDLAHFAIDPQLFLDDGNEEVYADRDPYLGLDGILGSAEEPLDTEMLLDPFEEQFHLPSAFVQLGYHQRWESEVVCEQDESVLGLGVEVSNTAERNRILLGCFGAFEDYALVAAQTCGLVDMTIGLPLVIHVALGTDHEERKTLREEIEAGEVDVATIHDIKGSWFQGEKVEDIDVVNLSFCNYYKRRDVATQIQKCVELHSAFAFPKASPRKEREAHVDGRRIESVGDMIQLQTEVVSGIQPSREADQSVSEVFVDTPVSFLVGIGQGASRNFAPDADVVELGTHSAQADFDIAEALPEGQLRECHRKELAET